MRYTALLFTLLTALVSLSADKEHGTLVRAATLHISPMANSPKVLSVERGRDMIVLETTNMDGIVWLKVFATVVEGEDRRDVTGWLPAKGLVTVSTPQADQIIYGEAVDSEQQAEQRGGRRGAAQDAMRLYYRVADLFPSSPLAAEAFWRSADIRWQLEKADILSRPSSREWNPDIRTPMDDHFMKEIIRRFPQSKWSDLAAYDMIDNKLCGDWKGLAHCPEVEADLYEHYAHEHPRSPKATEALYNAAWRQAALVEIYKIQDDEPKSSNSRRKALALAQEIVKQYPEAGDWKPRALDLIYKLEQNVAVYGPQTD